MDNDTTLNKILENTEVLKSAVVKVSTSKVKRATQINKAQKKFKKIGANFKIEEAKKIEQHCENLGINTSLYTKQLIHNDLKGLSNASCFKLLKIKLFTLFGF